ncbi:MAG: hypothetical protein HZA93_27610 [Verrucomicrobia bacterium]|nr:hypothetical protein [Verrucomicrobiota bacterium]
MSPKIRIFLGMVSSMKYAKANQPPTHFSGIFRRFLPVYCENNALFDVFPENNEIPKARPKFSG